MLLKVSTSDEVKYSTFEYVDLKKFEYNTNTSLLKSIDAIKGINFFGNSKIYRVAQKKR